MPKSPILREGSYADMIFVNGKIVTVDEQNRILQAVAIKQGRIVLVGKNEEIERLAGPNTRVIDLHGKILLPGFIDSHTHPPGAGTRIFTIDFRESNARSIRDIQNLIKERAEKIGTGSWIRCSNYNDLALEERRHVTRWELDNAAPSNPILITSDTGHLHIANSRALEIAGVTKNTPDPRGGQIDRNQVTGEVTGLLYETAGGLVSNLIPPYTLEETKEGLRHALSQFTEWGVTTTHDAGAGPTTIKAYQELEKAGELPIRILLMVRGQLESMVNLGIESGFGSENIKIMSLKIMADGSGAGGSAAVYQPQHRGTKGLGLMITPEEEIKKLTARAHENGIRVSIHAIGDRAIDVALDAIEEAQRKAPISDMRHRIEHCSLCPPKQMDRIKKLGVVPSVSIGYMWGIGDNYAENFGTERVGWLHPLKSMMERGIVAAGNSDYAVSTGNPLIQLCEAVTRKTINGNVISQEQAISVMDAIRLYTWNGAYIGKEEDVKGSIEYGKYADLVVLDKDILTIPNDDIKDVKVLMTVVGGKIVYSRD